jgi:hypothetical protein
MAFFGQEGERRKVKGVSILRIPAVRIVFGIDIAL